MIRVENRQLLLTLPFEQYLKIPAWSYSGIKLHGRDFTMPTQKMNLGTHVHKYLLTPEEYQHEDVNLVRPIAYKLKETIGGLLPHLIAEVCVTADMVFGGFRMKYKGRIDLGIPNKIIIDAKVTEMDIDKGIQFFGYDFQQTGYGLALPAPLLLIIAVNPKPPHKVQIKKIVPNEEWWMKQIVTKGEPIL